MKTVVTGPSGHVGVNLIRALLSRKRDVRAVCHVSGQGLEGLDIELVPGDVADIDSLLEAFRGADVVYHLAAHISLLMNDWPRCLAINVNGTANVIEACRRSGIRRMIHFSSIHALSQEPFDRPVDESSKFVDSPSAPPYDRSKAAGQKLVLQAIQDGLNAVIINPTGIIGPYDYRPSHFGQALVLMARGRLPMLIDGGFDWVDVRDVVEHAIKAEETAPAGSSYLLSGQWLSVKGVAETVAGLTGKSAPRAVCPMPVARFFAPAVTACYRAVRVRPIITTASLNALVSNRNIRHDKATRELGYHPRPISQTLADTVKWFRDNGYLGC